MHMFEFFYGVCSILNGNATHFEDAMITICKMQHEPWLGSQNDQILLCGELCLRDTLRGEHRLLTHAGETIPLLGKDNLRWGNPDATDEELVAACKLAQADDFVRSFPDSYDTWIEQGGTNVSGGQKQRLCIARALLKKPRVLILDDSTSAVDTATDAKIRRAFAQRIPGTTKIIIAQRISSVQDADRIIVMDNGRVEAFDTHENLLKKSDLYREIYETQTSGGGDFDSPDQMKGGDAQ